MGRKVHAFREQVGVWGVKNPVRVARNCDLQGKREFRPCGVPKLRSHSWIDLI
jgi:hypothetical protein